jgi:hypothetical protein
MLDIKRFGTLLNKATNLTYTCVAGGSMLSMPEYRMWSNLRWRCHAKEISTPLAKF